MGHSYSSFGVQAGFLPESIEGWELDPCILYGSQRVRRMSSLYFHLIPNASSTFTNGSQIRSKVHLFMVPGFFSKEHKCPKAASDCYIKGTPAHPTMGQLQGWHASKGFLHCLRIPEEIWKLVAANMSAADWARVSGTSRELSRVWATPSAIDSFERRCLAALVEGTRASKIGNFFVTILTILIITRMPPEWLNVLLCH